MKIANNLDSQTKYVRCVIDYPFGRELQDILSLINSFGWLFVFGVHDKDCKGNGELKTKHCHLVIISAKRHRLKYYLTHIQDMFLCNINAISVDICENLCRDIQYITHKNNPDKFQYDTSIITTNLTKEEFAEFYNVVTESYLSFSVLLNIITSSNTRADVIRRLGLHNYNTYRNTINDLIKDGYLGITKFIES